jgi:hypothetical protein
MLGSIGDERTGSADRVQLPAHSNPRLRFSGERRDNLGVEFLNDRLGEVRDEQAA